MVWTKGACDNYVFCNLVKESDIECFGCDLKRDDCLLVAREVSWFKSLRDWIYKLNLLK